MESYYGVIVKVFTTLKQVENFHELDRLEKVLRSEQRLTKLKATSYAIQIKS